MRKLILILLALFTVSAVSSANIPNKSRTIIVISKQSPACLYSDLKHGATNSLTTIVRSKENKSFVAEKLVNNKRYRIVVYLIDKGDYTEAIINTEYMKRSQWKSAKFRRNRQSSAFLITNEIVQNLNNVKIKYYK